MTREELKVYLANNLLTSSQAAESLGMSKQMLTNHVRCGMIEPILNTSQGNLYLKADIEEFYNSRIMRMISKSIEDQNILFCNASTSSCLDFYENHRNHLGDIATVTVFFEEFDSIIRGNFQQLEENAMLPGFYYLVAPSMIIRDFEGKEIWLSGCNCGYQGEGPRGSIRILQQIGIDKDLSEKVYSNDILHYYFDEDCGWKVKCEFSHVRNYEYSSDILRTDISAMLYLRNSRLVLLQRNYPRFYFAANPKLFLEKYCQFAPNPQRILLLTDTQARSMGYVGYDGCGKSYPYNLVVIDESGREIWLHVNMDREVPIRKQYSLMELMKECGFGVDSNESLSERLKSWLGITPARANVCELMRMR